MQIYEHQFRYYGIVKNNRAAKGTEMTDIKRLNEIIEEHGIKKKVIANRIGILPSTLTTRLNGHSDFKVSEAAKLADILGLTPAEKMRIFFDPNYD